MAQQKSPSDVRLLTPANLREIRAAVLRWVRDNPADIRAKMEQAREMLESIIRYRLREKLGPAIPKPPVLGGIGVAYGAEEYSDDDRYIYMDSGMSIFQIDFFGEPINVTYPVPVYGGQEITDYAGDVMPSTATEYLIQRGTGDTCPTFPTEFTWDSEGSYLSELYSGFKDLSTLYKPCAVTALHTGLTRLAVQAKVGAGRSAAELSAWSSPPGVCALNPYSDGIFRDDNYVYWVFRTNADGCKCAKLFTDQTQALCIADWLSNGDITDLETASRAEAYLLSTLEVEYDNEGNIAEEYTLLSAAEISDVYSDGKDVLGETGWHYSRGHQGVNDGLVYECVIVTHKVVLEGGAPPTAAYRQADLFRIEFNLSGLTPTATLVHDEANVDWEPGANDFIFYPVITETESKLCYVDHAAAIVYDPRGAGAPIYAFYADGGLEVIRYTYSEGPLVTIPAPAVRVCGFGGRKETGIQYYGGTGRLSSITADYSGVSIGTQEPDNKFATHRYDEWQLVVAGGGSMDFTAGSRTQIRIWAAGDCNGLDVTGWPSSQINYAILFGTSQGYKTETRVRQASVIKIAIIPHGDSEAVYMTELVNGEITSQTRVRYEDWEIVDSRYKLTPNISMDKPSEGFGAVVDVPITPGLGVPGSQWWVINNVYFEDNVREVSEAGAPAGTGYKSCVSKLITSKGVITVGGGLSQDYDDWTEWPNVEILPGNCHPAATCWTQTSYFHGDSWFSSGPASSKVLYNGYDIATQPSTEFWRVVPLGWN